MTLEAGISEKKIEDQWAAWEMLDSPKPPPNFLFNVEDERIFHLITSVWRRLPDYDQATLEALVLEVFLSSTQSEHVLASVGPVDPAMPYDGIVAQVVEDESVVVDLGRTKEVRSDSACMFVIAHEFAHVVLRHNQIKHVVAALAPFGEPYGDKERAQQRQWHEDEADLQAWVWGFQEELAAFREEFPESRRPRWYVEITCEPGPSNVRECSA